MAKRVKREYDPYPCDSECNEENAIAAFNFWGSNINNIDNSFDGHKEIIFIYPTVGQFTIKFGSDSLPNDFENRYVLFLVRKTTFIYFIGGLRGDELSHFLLDNTYTIAPVKLKTNQLWDAEVTTKYASMYTITEVNRSVDFYANLYVRFPLLQEEVTVDYLNNLIERRFNLISTIIRMTYGFEGKNYNNEIANVVLENGFETQNDDCISHMFFRSFVYPRLDEPLHENAILKAEMRYIGFNIERVKIQRDDWFSFILKSEDILDQCNMKEIVKENFGTDISEYNSVVQMMQDMLECHSRQKPKKMKIYATDKIELMAPFIAKRHVVANHGHYIFEQSFIGEEILKRIARRNLEDCLSKSKELLLKSKEDSPESISNEELKSKGFDMIAMRYTLKLKNLITKLETNTIKYRPGKELSAVSDLGNVDSKIFPPCMQYYFNVIEKTAHLKDPQRLNFTSFLLNDGLPHSVYNRFVVNKFNSMYHKTMYSYYIRTGNTKRAG